MAAKVEDDEEDEDLDERPPAFAEKLRSYFDHGNPEMTDVRSQPVWCVGELLEFGGNLNGFVTSLDLAKQEGIVFRHVQRTIMLCGEFERALAIDLAAAAAAAATATAAVGDWRAEPRELAAKRTGSCWGVDPTSTDRRIAKVGDTDVIDAEAAKLAAGTT